MSEMFKIDNKSITDLLQVVFDTFKTRHGNVLDLDFYLSKSESSGINIYKNTISTQKHISVSTRTHMYNTENT